MTMQNKSILAGAILVFVVALALIAVAIVNNQASSVIASQEFNPNAINTEVATIPDGLGGLSEGETPNDFTLLSIDGRDVSLSDFAGQPIVVNFWATWCAPCQFEMPELQAAFEKYNADGVVILALDQGESAEIVQEFFSERGLTFTALLDTRSVVAADFGAYSILPSTYFIAPDGTVSGIWRGPLNTELLDQFIQEILPANEAN
jgi:peroxiredoxin